MDEGVRKEYYSFEQDEKGWNEVTLPHSINHVPKDPVMMGHLGLFPFKMEITEELNSRSGKEAVISLKVSSYATSTSTLFYNGWQAAYNNSSYQGEAMKDPDLWSVESPNLYLAHVVLMDEEGREIDDVYEGFGVRTIKMRGSHFYLNNKKIVPRGTHDMANYFKESMICPSDRAIVTDILLHKGMNATCSRWPSDIRMHYYKRIAEYADQLGFMISWTGYFELWMVHPEMEMYARRDTRAMVRSLRNRPSSIIGRLRDNLNVFAGFYLITLVDSWIFYWGVIDANFNAMLSYFVVQNCYKKTYISGLYGTTVLAKKDKIEITISNFEENLRGCSLKVTIKDEGERVVKEKGGQSGDRRERKRE